MKGLGSDWITVSSIGCLPNEFNVYEYDGIPAGDTSIKQICALVNFNAKEIISNLKRRK